ncbi:MAG: alpha/beta fold hydrolase [Anaerolineae bacterium]|nr:alpha/beta fold hydrolase [Anaerolineae bacterium]
MTRWLRVILLGWVSIALILGTAGVQGPEHRAAAQADAVPRFEPSACPFGDTPDDVTCGYLVVPEDRADPASPTIRLAVAILASRSDTPAPDPVIYLEGGPGGSPLAFPEDYYDLAIRDNRDLILFDQRGTGYSEPSLDCPEQDQLALDTLDDDLSPETDREGMIETARACRDRLVADGVNLAAYNSAASAADIADLRSVLGIETWNLYGISYGTRLALTVMRDYPDGVRSVVLDSVYPPMVSGYSQLLPNAKRAFDAFFAYCAGDPTCGAVFPDLGASLRELVTQLEADPVLVPVTHPFSGESYDLLFDGEELLNTTFNLFYYASLLGYYPALIRQAQGGNYSELANLAVFFAVIGEFIDEGMYYSVQCNEEISYDPVDDFLVTMDDYPDLALVVMSLADYAICEEWGAGVGESFENEPVVSAIPTLVMSGEYDPITPPAWGRLVVETLSNGYAYEYPALSHGVTFDSGCPVDMMLAFLDDPATAPDASCIDAMPDITVLGL